MVTGFATQYWVMKHNLNPVMAQRDFTQMKLKSLILTAVMTKDNYFVLQEVKMLAGTGCLASWVVDCSQESVVV